MSATHLSHMKLQDRTIGPRPLSAMLLTTALAIAVASCLILIAPIALTAAKMALQADPPTVAQCAMIPAGAERLACFDQLGKQALRQPAKGAYAPSIAR